MSIHSMVSDSDLLLVGHVGWGHKQMKTSFGSSARLADDLLRSLSEEACLAGAYPALRARLEERREELRKSIDKLQASTAVTSSSNSKGKYTHSRANEELCAESTHSFLDIVLGTMRSMVGGASSVDGSLERDVEALRFTTAIVRTLLEHLLRSPAQGGLIDPSTAKDLIFHFGPRQESVALCLALAMRTDNLEHYLHCLSELLEFPPLEMQMMPLPTELRKMYEAIALNFSSVLQFDRFVFRSSLGYLRAVSLSHRSEGFGAAASSMGARQTFTNVFVSPTVARTLLDSETSKGWSIGRLRYIRLTGENEKVLSTSIANGRIVTGSPISIFLDWMNSSSQEISNISAIPPVALTYLEVALLYDGSTHVGVMGRDSAVLRRGRETEASGRPPLASRAQAAEDRKATSVFRTRPAVATGFASFVCTGFADEHAASKKSLPVRVHFSQRGGNEIYISCFGCENANVGDGPAVSFAEYVIKDPQRVLRSRKFLTACGTKDNGVCSFPEARFCVTGLREVFLPASNTTSTGNLISTSNFLGSVRYSGSDIGSRFVSSNSPAVASVITEDSRQLETLSAVGVGQEPHIRFLHLSESSSEGGTASINTYVLERRVRENPGFKINAGGVDIQSRTATSSLVFNSAHADSPSASSAAISAANGNKEGGLVIGNFSLPRTDDPGDKSSFTVELWALAQLFSVAVPGASSPSEPGQSPSGITGATHQLFTYGSKHTEEIFIEIATQPAGSAAFAALGPNKKKGAYRISGGSRTPRFGVVSASFETNDISSFLCSTSGSSSRWLHICLVYTGFKWQLFVNAQRVAETDSVKNREVLSARSRFEPALASETNRLDDAEDNSGGPDSFSTLLVRRTGPDADDIPGQESYAVLNSHISLQLPNQPRNCVLGKCYAGSLAEVRVWSISRTEADLNRDMHRQLPPAVCVQSSLVGYFPLDEQRGLVLTDCSRNGGHALLVSSAVTFLDFIQSQRSSQGTGSSLDSKRPVDSISIAGRTLTTTSGPTGGSATVSTSVTTVSGPQWMVLTEPFPVALVEEARFVEDFVPAVWASNSARDVKVALHRTSQLEGYGTTFLALGVPVDSTRTVVFEYACPNSRRGSGCESKTSTNSMMLISETVFELPAASSVLLSIVYRSDFQESGVKSPPLSGRVSAQLCAVFYSEKVDRLLVRGSMTSTAPSEATMGADEDSPFVSCLGIAPLRNILPDEGMLANIAAKGSREYATPFSSWSLLELLGACSQRALRTLNEICCSETEALIIRSLPPLIVRPTFSTLLSLSRLLAELRVRASLGTETERFASAINSVTALLALNIRIFRSEARLHGFFSPSQQTHGFKNNSLNTNCTDIGGGAYSRSKGGDERGLALIFTEPCDDASLLIRRLQETCRSAASDSHLMLSNLSPLRLLEHLCFAPFPNQLVAQHECSIFQSTLLHEAFPLLLTDKAAIGYITSGYRQTSAVASGNSGVQIEDPFTPSVILFLSAIRHYSDPVHLIGIPVERVLNLGNALLTEVASANQRLWSALQLSNSQPDRTMSDRVCELAVGCIATVQQVLVSNLMKYIESGSEIPPLKLPSSSQHLPMSPTSPYGSVSSAFPAGTSSKSASITASSASNPAVAMASFIISVAKAAEGMLTYLANALKRPAAQNGRMQESIVLETHTLLTKGLVGSVFPTLFVLVPSFPLPILGCFVKYLGGLRDAALGLMASTTLKSFSAAAGDGSDPALCDSRAKIAARSAMQSLIDFVSSLTLVWTQTSCVLLLPARLPKNQGLPSATSSVVPIQQTSFLIDSKPLGFPHERLFRGGLQKKGTSRDAALRSLLQGVGAINKVFVEVQSEHVGLRGGDKSLMLLERLVMAALCSALMPTASLMSPTKAEISALFEHVKAMRPWLLSERQKNPEEFVGLIEQKVQLLCSFEPCIVDSRWSSSLAAASKGPSSPSTSISQQLPQSSAEVKSNSARLLEVAKGARNQPSTSTIPSRETARKWRKTFVAWKAFRQLRSLMAVLQGNATLEEAEVAQLVSKYLNDSEFTPVKIEAQLLSTMHLGAQKLVGLLGIRQLLHEHRHGRRLSSSTVSLLAGALCGWHYQQYIYGCPAETLARVRGAVFQLVDEVIKDAARSISNATPSSRTVADLPKAQSPNSASGRLSAQSRARTTSGVFAPRSSRGGAMEQGRTAENHVWLEMALSLIASPWEIADFSKLPVAVVPHLLVNVCKTNNTIGLPRLNHTFPSTYFSARVSPSHCAHSVVLGPSGLVARGTGLRGCCVMPLLWDAQYHEEQQKLLAQLRIDKQRTAAPSTKAIIRLPLILYYEVTIVDLSANASVGIGVGPSDYNLSRPPGWDARSFALHDDGVLFTEGSTGRQINASIGLGDVIGCGFNREKRTVFFTKNGKDLGITIDIRPEITNVCPLFGFDAKGLIKLNFGAEPFVYTSLDESMIDSNKSRGKPSSVRVSRSLPQRCWDTFKIYSFRVCSAFRICKENALVLSRKRTQVQDAGAEEASNEVAVESAMQHVLAALCTMLESSYERGLDDEHVHERMLAVLGAIGHVLACFPRAPSNNSHSKTQLSHLTVERLKAMGDALLRVVESLVFGRLPSLFHSGSATEGANDRGFFAPALAALKGVEFILQIVSPSVLRNTTAAPEKQLADTNPESFEGSLSFGFANAILSCTSIAARALEGALSQQAVGWWVIGMLRRINSGGRSEADETLQNVSDENNAEEEDGGSTERRPWIHPWSGEVHKFIKNNLEDGTLSEHSSPSTKAKARLLLPLAILGAGTSPIPLPGDAVLRRPKMYECGQVLSYLLDDEVVTILGTEAEDATAAMIGFDFSAPSPHNAVEPRQEEPRSFARYTMGTSRVRVASTEDAVGAFASTMSLAPSATADVMLESVVDTSDQNLASRRRLLTTSAFEHTVHRVGGGGGACSPPLFDVSLPNHLEQIAQLFEVCCRLWLIPFPSNTNATSRRRATSSVDVVKGEEKTPVKGSRAGAADDGLNHSTALSHSSINRLSYVSCPTVAPSANSLQQGSSLVGAQLTNALPGPLQTGATMSSTVPTSLLLGTVDSLIDARLLQCLWIALQSLHGWQQRFESSPILSARVANVANMLFSEQATDDNPAVVSEKSTLLVAICNKFCNSPAFAERGLSTLLEESAVLQAALQENTASTATSAITPHHRTINSGVGLFGLGGASPPPSPSGQQQPHRRRSQMTSALGSRPSQNTQTQAPVLRPPSSTNLPTPSPRRLGSTSPLVLGHQVQAASTTSLTVTTSLTGSYRPQLSQNASANVSASSPQQQQQQQSLTQTSSSTSSSLLFDEQRRSIMVQELASYGFDFALCVTALESTGFDFSGALAWIASHSERDSLAGGPASMSPAEQYSRGGVFFDPEDGGLRDEGVDDAGEDEECEEMAEEEEQCEENEEEEEGGSGEEDAEEEEFLDEGRDGRDSVPHSDEDGTEEEGAGEEGESDEDATSESESSSSHDSLSTSNAYDGFSLKGGSYITVTSDTPLGSQYTIDLWVKCDTVDNDLIVFCEARDTAAGPFEDDEDGTMIGRGRDATNTVWFTIQGSVARFGLWDAMDPAITSVFSKPPEIASLRAEDNDDDAEPPSPPLHTLTGQICEAVVGTAELGRWTNYTCVQDGADFLLYKNGQLQARATRLSGKCAQTNLLQNPLCLGGCIVFPERSFSGEIKSIRVFDSCLHLSVVSALHSASQWPSVTSGEGADSRALASRLVAGAEQSSLVGHFRCDEGKFPFRNSAIGASAAVCTLELVGDIQWSSTVDEATAHEPQHVVTVTLPEVDFTTHGEEEQPYTVDATSLDMSPSVLYRQLKRRPIVETVNKLQTCSQELCTHFASRVVISGLLFAKGPLLPQRSATEPIKPATGAQLVDTSTPPPTPRPTTAPAAGGADSLPKRGIESQPQTSAGIPAIGGASLGRLGNPSDAHVPSQSSPSVLATQLRSLVDKSLLRALVGVAVSTNDPHLVALFQHLLVELMSIPIPLAVRMMDAVGLESRLSDIPLVENDSPLPYMTPPRQKTTPPSAWIASPSSPSDYDGADGGGTTYSQIHELQHNHPVALAFADIVAELLERVNVPQSIESFESNHPCRSLNDPPREVSFPKQQFYDIFFDQRGTSGSVLTTFYTDQSLSNIVAQHGGYAFRLKGSKFVFDVRLEGAIGPSWGYRMSVVHNSHQQLISAKLLRTMVHEATRATVLHPISGSSGSVLGAGRAISAEDGWAGMLTLTPQQKPSPRRASPATAQDGKPVPTLAITLAPMLLNTSTANALINAVRVNVGRARRCISSILVRILRYPRIFLLPQHQLYRHKNLRVFSSPVDSASSVPQIPDFSQLNDLRRQLDKQFRKELGLSIHSRFVQSISRLLLAVRDATLCWSEDVLRQSSLKVKHQSPNRQGVPQKSCESEAKTPTPSPRRGGAKCHAEKTGDMMLVVAPVECTLVDDTAESEVIDNSRAKEEEERFQQLRHRQKALYADRQTDGHERVGIQRRALHEKVRVEPNSDKTFSVWCEQAGGAVSANVAVGGGKWYFEVKLISGGDVTIGLAAAVGDEGRVEMWGLNGRFGLVTTPRGTVPAREYFVSPSSAPELDPSSRRSQRLWKGKDVVGVLIDADSRQLRYFVNGLELPYVIEYGSRPRARLQAGNHGEEDWANVAEGFDEEDAEDDVDLSFEVFGREENRSGDANLSSRDVGTRREDAGLRLASSQMSTDSESSLDRDERGGHTSDSHNESGDDSSSTPSSDTYSSSSPSSSSPSLPPRDGLNAPEPPSRDVQSGRTQGQEASRNGALVHANEAGVGRGLSSPPLPPARTPADLLDELTRALRQRSNHENARGRGGGAPTGSSAQRSQRRHTARESDDDEQEVSDFYSRVFGNVPDSQVRGRGVRQQVSGGWNGSSNAASADFQLNNQRARNYIPNPRAQTNNSTSLPPTSLSEGIVSRMLFGGLGLSGSSRPVDSLAPTLGSTGVRAPPMRGSRGNDNDNDNVYDPSSRFVPGYELGLVDNSINPTINGRGRGSSGQSGQFSSASAAIDAIMESIISSTFLNQHLPNLSQQQRNVAPMNETLTLPTRFSSMSSPVANAHPFPTLFSRGRGGASPMSFSEQSPSFFPFSRDSSALRSALNLAFAGGDFGGERSGHRGGSDGTRNGSSSTNPYRFGGVFGGDRFDVRGGGRFGISNIFDSFIPDHLNNLGANGFGMGSDEPPEDFDFPVPRGDGSGGEEGGGTFAPWLVFGTDECVVLNLGSRYFEHEIPHGALPLDPANLGAGSLIPFNQLRAFDDVAAAFALQAPSPPFFNNDADPIDAPLDRDGPSHVSLTGPAEIMVGPTEIKNSGVTYATAIADCSVSGSGKWYYEVTLTSNGLMQIGWCEKNAELNKEPERLPLPGGDGRSGVGGGGTSYRGVGDTKCSFAIDLFRRVLWCGGDAVPLVTASPSRRWVAGDIIGCAIDLSSATGIFTLNGRHLAQIQVPSSEDVGALPALAPAISLRSGNGCTVNFGTTPFRFKPEGFGALGVPDAWAERIDTYYNTVTSLTAARRLLRLERSLAIGTNSPASRQAVSSSANTGVGSESFATNILSSPDPRQGYQQPLAADLSPFVTPSKPVAVLSSPERLSPSLPPAGGATSATSLPTSSPFQLPLKVYTAFVTAVNECCAEKDKEESQLPADALVTYALEKVPSLKHFDLERVLSELRNYARIAKVAIPMISFEGKGFDAVSSLLTSTRMLLFARSRESLFNAMLKETNSRAEHFRLTINRSHSKAAAFRAAVATGASTANLPRPPLSTTVFGQTVMLLGEQHPRIFKTSKRFWTTSFAGEGAEDAGGPFRAHINDICAELMSSALPLFVPTANNVHNVGDFREAFVPAAGATGLRNASLFRFVGKLMGGCIRNGEPMGVYFPPIFWKKLSRLGPFTLHDLAGMDKVCVQCVDEFASMRSQYGNDVAEEVFNDTFAGETFMTRLSDGTIADLVPNGRSVPVTFDRCEEYAKGIAEARLREFDRQIDWIREGLLSVIPEVCLALLAPHELEMRVCGKSDYTVKELKEGASFEGLSSDDKRVQFLWSALESATPKQRRLFLKFVSGRERMPVKLRVLPLVTPQNPDTVLPRAATCFFAIELPDYSCEEVMRKKLIYSIENCAEIDTDFRARDIDPNDGPQLHIGSEDRAEEDPNSARE